MHILEEYANHISFGTIYSRNLIQNIRATKKFNATYCIHRKAFIYGTLKKIIHPLQTVSMIAAKIILNFQVVFQLFLYMFEENLIQNKIQNKPYLLFLSFPICQSSDLSCEIIILSSHIYNGVVTISNKYLFKVIGVIPLSLRYKNTKERN